MVMRKNSTQIPSCFKPRKLPWERYCYLLSKWCKEHNNWNLKGVEDPAKECLIRFGIGHHIGIFEQEWRNVFIPQHVLHLWL